jgi:hypothetical protein
MDMKSNQSVNSVDLRYMQVEVSLEDGALLPGVDTVESFRMCEYISLIERTPQGLICYLRLEYDHPQVLKMKHGGFEILEIKSQNERTALVKAFASGPLTRIFCKDEEAWWVNPTKLSSTGMKMTIRGTMKGMRRVRTELEELVGNGFTVKLGSETLQEPEFMDMLPQKQRLVLDKAIEMGYYSIPRGCTQRDIAQVLDITQATVSEHLQSAEAKIIHSISN